MPVPDLHPLVVSHDPAAWPAASREHNDQDADVPSSVSSHGSFTANLRSRKDSNSKAHRRWAYAGPAHPYVRPTRSLSPARRTSGPLGAAAYQEAKLSPVTVRSVSTAPSSPWLDTPDLADWPTELGQSPLLDDFAPFPASPSSVIRFSKASPVQKGRNAAIRPSRFSSPVASNQFLPSSRLDPPLSNIVHGLLPLTLSFPDLMVDFAFPEPPSAPPSPRPAIRSLHPLDPSRVSINRSLPERPALSLEFPVSSISSSSTPHVSDSPVLPPRNLRSSLREDQDDDDMQRSQVQEMDAFAFATAVAASTSRLSFSLPPSVQSTTEALPSVVTSTPASTVPHPGRDRASSAHTQASADPPYMETLPYLRETASVYADTERLTVPSAENQARARRASAPPPIDFNWEGPRLQPTRTISSRVDVGQDIATGKSRGSKPVMGKVRKFGERIRGFFKGKPDDSPQGKADMGTIPEYGMMTTTTAVTNVEYESHHPIPLPSPRTKLMRSHRRSLPLPLFIPGVHRNHSSPYSELPIPEEQDVPRYASTFSQRDGAASGAHKKAERRLSSYDPEDISRSPRTPKPRRQPSQTTPRTSRDERDAHDQPYSTNILRRFSLSSTLAKPKIDQLRSTVVPRPHFLTVSSRDEYETAPSYSAQLLAASHAGPSTSIPDSNLPVYHGHGAVSREQFWGGELPAARPVNPGLCIARSSSERSLAQPRIPTTPSQPHTPSQLEVGGLVPKEKRSRRFSLSSFMGRRPLLAPTSSQGQESSSPVTPGRTSILGRRRPRGDTLTAATPPSIVASEPDHAPLPPTWELPPSYRNSVFSSSSGAESMYFDAREESSEEDHRSSLGRPSSPRPESDLDSMSFARTPDYSSGTFSFGSSTEREYYLDITNGNGPSTSAAHPYYYHSAPDPDRLATSSTLAHLVGDSSSARGALTKTLRFSPSLLSFDVSRSDYEEDEEDGMEQEEEMSFMRALGFEFDEIARRVREEPL